MHSLLQTGALPIALVVIASAAGIWLNLISTHVPDPYLDEFFHVPQAQRYCKGDYSWDPKITTPPGLYMVSLLLQSVLRIPCHTYSLRALNAGAICVVCILAYDILRNLRARTSSNQKEKATRVGSQKGGHHGEQTALFDAHSALNISLFPPLFFFSGLYYTDIISTLLVLLSYNTFLKKGRGRWRFWEDVTFVQIGIVALSFRQTNIFWVAVFPAGLSVIDAIKRGESITYPKDISLRELIDKSWSEGFVYDCDVGDAGFKDVVLLSVSIPLAAVGKLLFVLRLVLPHIILLGLFAGFVVWNGGVVLGDKSAHVATLHLPQMLYVWPYIIFFSLPVVVSPLVAPVAICMPTGTVKTFVQDTFIGQAKPPLPHIISAVFFLAFGFAAVHFNTIVHPYTLADNRHYVFYVFRILRMHAAIKYAAVPVYYTCYWMAVQALGSSRPASAVDKERRREKVRPAGKGADRVPCQLSFFVIWLATTALSVITAPLVEPRYFIVPWIIWRLHVPSMSASYTKRSSGGVSYDLRLVLETVWLLAINAVVGYNFLYRGFSWPSEAGAVQRFLW
ncbi:DIE2/ALG10 family-domain-containing protein [Clohesyomyces aquaticus]|uniref:Dol-P-Glc:Glc(2)Man(9)GlcNAc(2)-PP-Dol alpha-1,2-glucosyltransferase n=1 Tax=Clohesyomyces aquaticus TaxID=1231657 RepID=A0A1Y1ZF76_9PLEO|nr:DIE2/ALG10 family-domain-containing protein [Clohesyomyces aquaticus]